MDNSNMNTNTEPYYDKYNFSRGVKRLPNHNGPETRSMLHDIHYKSNDKGEYTGYSTPDLLNYGAINDTPADSYKKIHDDIYECPDDDKLYNTDNESEDEGNEIREEFDNFATLSKKLDDKLQNDLPPSNHNDSSKNVHNESGTIMNPTNNLYDLILYIFTGVFYLVLCDFIYKLGKKTY
jgi:hypothetical protein